MKAVLLAAIVALSHSTDSKPATQPVYNPVAITVSVADLASVKFSKATEGLQDEVRLRTELLLADPENRGRVTLESGYRTPEQQQRQIDCHAKGEQGCMPADPIEKSTHVKGKAIDLSGPKELRLKLAQRYGFFNPHKRADRKEDHHFELNPNRSALTGAAA